MFGTLKKAMVAGAVLAVGALGAPSMASAVTATPPLTAPETQAAVSLTSNGARVAAARTASGVLTLNSIATGVTVQCTVTATINFDLLGTAVVNGVTFSPACPVGGVPGPCTATAAVSPAPNNTWGARVITWAGASPVSGTYVKANVSFQNTFNGTAAACAPLPPGVAFAETGTIWFRVGAFGGGAGITSAVPTAPNNVVNNPALGNALITGSMTVSNPGTPPVLLFPTM